MACEDDLVFGTSMRGLPLEAQLTQHQWRQGLREIGPAGWREVAQICDALSIQLRREELWRKRLTDRLFENGIPIPLPADMSCVES